LETMMRLPACLFSGFIETLSEQNRPADVAPVHHISDEALRKPKIYVKRMATLSAAKFYQVNEGSAHPSVYWVGSCCL
jgi:hypothetical protein